MGNFKISTGNSDEFLLKNAKSKPKQTNAPEKAAGTGKGPLNSFQVASLSSSQKQRVRAYLIRTGKTHL